MVGLNRRSEKQQQQLNRKSELWDEKKHFWDIMEGRTQSDLEINSTSQDCGMKIIVVFEQQEDKCWERQQKNFKVTVDKTFFHQLRNIGPKIQKAQSSV